MNQKRLFVSEISYCDLLALFLTRDLTLSCFGLGTIGAALFIWYWARWREEFKQRYGEMEQNFERTKKEIERGMRPTGKNYGYDGQ